MCTCQNCGRKYKIDILIPDKLWVKITPSENPEGGLLCGNCIMNKLEDILDYSAFNLEIIVINQINKKEEQ